MVGFKQHSKHSFKKCSICGRLSLHPFEADDTFLCKSCLEMLLCSGLLFEYDADTPFHYYDRADVELLK